jgi:hypothetical protein
VTDPLYRIATEPLVSGNFLVTRESNGDKPQFRSCPVTLWSCPASGCPVREVEVAAQYVGPVPKAPPAMHCPHCRTKMNFWTYLAERLLVPVAGSGVAGGAQEGSPLRQIV